MTASHEIRRREGGATLLVVLLLLMGITLISVSSVNTSVMELRMARNVESSASTFQTALAAIDFVIADPANLPMVGPLNESVPVTLSGSPFTVGAGDSIKTSAARVAECAAPPRMRNATSLLAYSAFQYDVTVSLDKNATGMGKSGIVQGYLQIGPKC